MQYLNWIYENPIFDCNFFSIQIEKINSLANIEDEISELEM